VILSGACEGKTIGSTLNFSFFLGAMALGWANVASPMSMGQAGVTSPLLQLWLDYIALRL
jgi:hypothetical protein